ncbi:hypothetical protein EOM39_01615 [Candidatus Gracilibacteria bacterium]|nr:hypothetical protein [Candidatus Gracilibacteria bacterium]
MTKLFKLIFAFILLFIFNYSYSASSVDHFDIKLGSDEIAIDKAVDMTIEAKDSDGNLVKDYRGTILIMSETDPKAEFPKEIKDNSYKFTESDGGKAKFENSLIFRNLGKQQVNVFDFNNEDVTGMAEINVIDESDEDVISIKISSPSDGSILTNNFITLAGSTKKNHQVSIKVTGTKTERTVKTESNSDGLYEKKIENLDDGDYKVYASVINSEGKEAGKTEEVKVSIKTKKPEFNSFKVKPYEIHPEDKINLEVKATKDLATVKVMIEDTIIELKETKEGVYTGSTTAPKKEGEYDVEINLIDDLGNQVNKLLPEELNVLPGTGIKSGCDPELDEDCDIECDPNIEDCTNKTIIKKKIFKINNLRLTKLKTKSILSWDPIDEAVSYNIYKQLPSNQLVLVDNVRIPSYEIPIVGKKVTYDLFVVEPVVLDGSGQTIKGQLSEVTEIQTGPKELLLLLFLSFLIGLFILVFKHKKIKV